MVKITIGTTMILIPIGAIVYFSHGTHGLFIFYGILVMLGLVAGGIWLIAKGITNQWILNQPTMGC